MIDDLENPTEVKVIANPDEAKVCEVLRVDFPEEFRDLEVSEVKPFASGANNAIFEVRGVLFRFPYKEFDEFGRWVNAVTFLKGRLSVQIPEILYEGKSARYLGYKKVEGEMIPDHQIALWNEAEQEQLIQDIARVFVELHRIPIDEALAAGIPEHQPLSEKRIGELSDVITKEFEDEAIRSTLYNLLTRFRELEAKSTKQVLTHGDVGDQNITVDSESKRVQGVIDFGDTQVGDPCLDLFTYYYGNPEFGTKIIREYEKQTGEQISMERIEVYSRINDIKRVAKKRSPDRVERAMSRLTEFALHSAESGATI